MSELRSRNFGGDRKYPTFFNVETDLNRSKLCICYDYGSIISSPNGSRSSSESSSVQFTIQKDNANEQSWSFSNLDW